MALKVELKPGERIIIGECVVTNVNQRARLLIDGQVPILREKDIMTAGARTLAKRIYLAIQLMYTARRPQPSRNLLQAAWRNSPGRAQLLPRVRKHQQSNLNGQHVQSAQRSSKTHRLRAGTHCPRNAAQAYGKGCEADGRSARPGSELASAICGENCRRFTIASSSRTTSTTRRCSSIASFGRSSFLPSPIKIIRYRPQCARASPTSACSFSATRLPSRAPATAAVST